VAEVTSEESLEEEEETSEEGFSPECEEDLL